MLPSYTTPAALIALFLLGSIVLSWLSLFLFSEQFDVTLLFYSANSKITPMMNPADIAMSSLCPVDSR